MAKAFSFFSATIALAFAASAADVAFYSFTDGQAGQDAIGATLSNSVDPSSLIGNVTLYGSGATATFLDDIPGRYLYTNSTWSADCIYREDIYRSLQTTWVTNSPQSVASGTSGTIDGLGARLSALDEWTVEFFFKYDELLFANYQQNVLFGDDENIRICLENKYTNGTNTSVRVFSGGVLTRNATPALSWNSAEGKSLAPGLWHHLAVSYKRSTRLLTAVLDYTHTGSNTCTNAPATTGALILGNNRTAARYAALRVTDRVLSASEFMRASEVPPDGGAGVDSDERFHWTFELEEAGDSLGTVQNSLPWSLLYAHDGTNQYTYAADGAETFLISGNGVVTPLTYAYTNEAIGTLVMDFYASNVTEKTQSVLQTSDGKLRANKMCAYIQAGPKNAPSEVFGKGPKYRMSTTNLLTASDFTAETYFKPDVDGWNAILGDDAAGRYRASIFGVKCSSAVSGSITIRSAWAFHMNMNNDTLNFNAVVENGDGTFQEINKWNIMQSFYQARCKDGKMHHYAVVYRVSDSENEGSPTVRLYIDHEEGYVITLPGPIIDHGLYCKDVCFTLGSSETNNHPMQGWFDEVRYTARALDPSEFLTLRGSLGTMLFFH